MEGYLAEIRLFAGNFAPRNWAFCAGQLLAISQNTALFSLIGCTYGGDCRTSFALPDLRGRVPLSSGQGPGLTDRTLGSRTGAQTETLIITEIPPHNHLVEANGTAGSGSLNSPQNAFPGVGQMTGSGPTAQPINTNWAATANTTMSALMIGNTGGSQPHNNMQPSLALNYIICTAGIFPSRS